MPFVTDGQAEFLPFGDLRALIQADKDTVFFLDDLGQAPPTVQAAAMQLILARRINGHHVSDSVTFIAATNRKQDKAGVSGILEPVKSRFATRCTTTTKWQRPRWVRHENSGHHGLNYLANFPGPGGLGRKE